MERIQHKCVSVGGCNVRRARVSLEEEAGDLQLRWEKLFTGYLLSKHVTKLGLMQSGEKRIKAYRLARRHFGALAKMYKKYLWSYESKVALAQSAETKNFSP